MQLCLLSMSWPLWDVPQPRPICFFMNHVWRQLWTRCEASWTCVLGGLRWVIACACATNTTSSHDISVLGSSFWSFRPFKLCRLLTHSISPGGALTDAAHPHPSVTCGSWIRRAMPMTCVITALTEVLTTTTMDSLSALAMTCFSTWGDLYVTTNFKGSGI